MTAGTASARGVVQRIVQLLALLVVFAVLYGLTVTTPSFQGTTGVIASVGFLLLAGLLASELLDVVGLPHLTGYILVGVVAGPHVLHLVDHTTVERMQSVNTLALALIALAGGAELRMDMLRQAVRSLVIAHLFQSTLVFVGMAALFVALAPMLPFARELPFLAIIGAGLLWGALAVSRSPSATLAIFSQVRPRGPVSRFAMAFVMSSDLVVILLLTITLSFAGLLIEPGAEFSLDDLRLVGHEVLGSVSLGTTLGLLLGLYLRLVRGHLLLVLLALGFGLTEGLRYLHFDPLLTFLIAGFVVTNLTGQGAKLLESVDHTGSVIFVVFFATAGAHLDIPLLKELWPVALALASARAVMSIGAHYLGARVARDEATVRRWGWGGLISQAGLTLGLSVVIEKSFPSFGAGFRSLIVATVAINEVIGPILFKLSLDRSGESGRATNAFPSIPPPKPSEQ